VRFGIGVPPFAAPHEIVAVAVAAERGGWDGVFLWDHLVWRRPGLPIHDPWVLLGAIAARTERIRIGTYVTPLARRRPSTLAKQVTTLDHVSGGRAVLGVGVGEPGDADFAAFGDPADRRERARVLDEGLAVLVALLSGEAVEHHGPHFDVETRFQPRPVQLPHPPIWVAARAPATAGLRRALRFDGVAMMGAGGAAPPEEVAAYLGTAVERPPGWEVVVPWDLRHDPGEYEAAGATWLVDNRWPDGDWLAALAARAGAGPSPA
jgi:alkanesulfonate monooxygenase SsuD/methylene tetrahydromethanopterin reductase-like flavin-dependent oxidoreductase (luciferase family)